MSINKTWAISSAICLPVSVDMRVKPEDKTIIIPLPADCREQSLPSRIVLPINSIAWHNLLRGAIKGRENGSGSTTDKREPKFSTVGQNFDATLRDALRKQNYELPGVSNDMQRSETLRNSLGLNYKSADHTPAECSSSWFVRHTISSNKFYTSNIRPTDAQSQWAFRG